MGRGDVPKPTCPWARCQITVSAPVTETVVSREEGRGPSCRGLGGTPDKKDGTQEGSATQVYIEPLSRDITSPDKGSSQQPQTSSIKTTDSTFMVQSTRGILNSVSFNFLRRNTYHIGKDPLCMTS